MTQLLFSGDCMWEKCLDPCVFAAVQRELLNPPAPAAAAISSPLVKKYSERLLEMKLATAWWFEKLKLSSHFSWSLELLGGLRREPGSPVAPSLWP